MAAPASRRSGYSRRAQYGTFFGYAAGIAGILIGAALLIVSIVRPGAFSGLTGAAADAVEPAGQASASTRSEARGVLSAIGGYFDAGRRNAHLERQLEEAKTRLVEAQATADENRRLRALLGLAQQGQRPIAYATLTGSSAASTRRFATLGAGTDAGVGVGMPVRSQLGLVGRVLETGRSTSRVLLITDPESVVPVLRATDGLPAFAQGRGDGTLQLRLINLGVNPMKLGDVFVTSGTGGLYRPGTPVAVLHKLTRDGGIARLLSDPAATDFVIVEPIWAPSFQPGPAAVASEAP